MSTHMTKAAEARWRESWAELNGDADAFDARWMRRLGLSKSTVSARRRMLGLRERKLPRPPYWTAERDLELLRAWADWKGSATDFSRHWAKDRRVAASTVSGRRQKLLRVAS